MSARVLPWRRVVAVMSVAALAAAVCVVAGIWQWQRHSQRAEQVALVEANLGAPAAAPGEVLSADGSLPDGAVWRELELTGTYVGEPVLLRNRPIGAGPGFHVLGLVEVTSPGLVGRLLVVDRGFLVGALDSAADLPVPDPPADEVRLVVRARAEEPTPPRDAPPGQVQGIDVPTVVAAALGPEPSDAAADGAPLPWYGIVRSEDGARPGSLTPLPSPTTDLGSHLSYTFQWWVFALGALVGGVVLLRREAVAAEQDDGPASPRTPRAPRRERPRRRPTAEEEEDALLDAQAAPAAADPAGQHGRAGR